MGQNKKKNSRKSNIRQSSETNPHEIFKPLTNHTPGTISIFEIPEKEIDGIIDDIIDDTVKNLKKAIPSNFYSNSYITQTNLKPFVRYLLTEWIFDYDSLGSAPFEVKKVNIYDTNVFAYANIQISKKTGPNNKPQYFRTHSKVSPNMHNPEILETIKYEDQDFEFCRYGALYGQLSKALEKKPHLTTEKRKEEYSGFTLFLQYDHKIYYAYEKEKETDEDEDKDKETDEDKTNLEFYMLDDCRNTLERQYGGDSKDNSLKLQVSYHPNIQCNHLKKNNNFTNYDFWEIESKYPKIDSKILANLSKVHSFFTERKARKNGQEVKYYSDCQYLYSMFMKDAMTQESSIVNKLFAENYTNYNLSTILLDAFLPLLNAFPEPNDKTPNTNYLDDEYSFKNIQKDISNPYLSLIESLYKNFDTSENNSDKKENESAKITLIESFYLASEEITKLLLSINNIGIRLSVAQEFSKDIKSFIPSVNGKNIKNRQKILQFLDNLYEKLCHTVNIYYHIFERCDALFSPEYNLKIYNNMKVDKLATIMKQISKQTYNSQFHKINPSFAKINKLVQKDGTIKLRGKNVSFVNFLYHIIQTYSSYEAKTYLKIKSLNNIYRIMLDAFKSYFNNTLLDIQENLLSSDFKKASSLISNFTYYMDQFKNAFTCDKQIEKSIYFPLWEICAILFGIYYLLLLQKLLVSRNFPNINTIPSLDSKYNIRHSLYRKLFPDQPLIDTSSYHNEKPRELFYELLKTLSSPDDLFSRDKYLYNIKKANSKVSLEALNSYITYYKKPAKNEDPIE